LDTFYKKDKKKRVEMEWGDHDINTAFRLHIKHVSSCEGHEKNCYQRSCLVPKAYQYNFQLSS
jgi:hypothetical protein